MRYYWHFEQESSCVRLGLDCGALSSLTSALTPVHPCTPTGASTFPVVVTVSSTAGSDASSSRRSCLWYWY